jgi:hypothetical protein
MKQNDSFQNIKIIIKMYIVHNLSPTSYWSYVLIAMAAMRAALRRATPALAASGSNMEFLQRQRRCSQTVNPWLHLFIPSGHD